MKRNLWLTLIILLVLMTSCSGQPTVPADAPAPGTGEIFQIALPRLVIDLDRDGVPSILGISPTILKAFNVDVSGMAVPADTVNTMMEANIQHIELAAVGDRLVIMVNGKPMPQLGWSEASLQRALKLAGVFDVQNTETISKLMPWVTRLGLNIVMRFPRDGAAEIPLSTPGAAKALTISPLTDPPSLITKFEIRFDADGTAGILGVTTRDLGNLLGGASIGGLDPQTLLKLQGGNIQHMELRNRPDGLHLYSNGEPLPTLIWDTQLLSNLVEVYGQLDPQGALKPLIDVLVPTMDRADIGLLMHFPLAPDAQAIPAQMHD